MNILYSGDTKNITVPSIFLAGPTPRSADVPSWRPEAISLLESYSFKGTVFVPEYENISEMSSLNFNYDLQIEWEHFCLECATIILMWVPRDLERMPAFTTNVEYGMYIKSGKLLYGRPNDSVKNKYLDYCYNKFTPSNQEVSTGLDQLVFLSVIKASQILNKATLC